MLWSRSIPDEAAANKRARWVAAGLALVVGGGVALGCGGTEAGNASDTAVIDEVAGATVVDEAAGATSGDEGSDLGAVGGAGAGEPIVLEVPREVPGDDDRQTLVADVLGTTHEIVWRTQLIVQVFDRDEVFTFAPRSKETGGWVEIRSVESPNHGCVLADGEVRFARDAGPGTWCIVEMLAEAAPDQGFVETDGYITIELRRP